MSIIFRKNIITGLLRISLLFMFLGRAWQHLVWEGPYRNIFYNPQGFGRFLSWVSGDTLVEIYSNPFYENLLDGFYRFIGVIFLLGAFATLFYRPGFRFKRLAKYLIFGGMFSTILLSYGYFVGKHYLLTMLFEYSIQMMLPLVFLWSFGQGREKKMLVLIQLSTALTFLCHGLFAYGYHSQPGGFADMMIVFFGISETVARKSLEHIGLLDFIFAAIVCVPLGLSVQKSTWSKGIYYIVIIFLSYGVLWGYATAFARILVHFDSRFPLDTLSGYLFETLVRLGHGTFPLVILLRLVKQHKQIKG